MKPPFWNHGAAFYQPMILRHAAMWGRVAGLIAKRRVSSVFEVGCGLGHIAANVPRYCGVDLNPNVIALAQQRHTDAEFLVDDWLTMDTAALVGRFDMVLACGVIEHCAHWRPFAEKALALRPRLLVISFFLSGRAARQHIRVVEKPGCAPYYENRYPKADIVEGLAELGQSGRDEWQTFPHAVGEDALLTLTVRRNHE